MKIITIFVTCALMMLIPGCTSPVGYAVEGAGYRSSVYAGDYFLAVGTAGRIDRLYPGYAETVASPTDHNLNGVVYSGGIFVAVGDGGVILRGDRTGGFSPADSPVKTDLMSVTVFDGSFIAVGRKGVMLTSVNGVSWERIKSGVKNDILSVAANRDYCVAVTYESNVIIKKRGIDEAEIFDYNKTYDGFATLFNMRAIKSYGGEFLVFGDSVLEKGAPIVFKTPSGLADSWSQYNLEMINDTSFVGMMPINLNDFAPNDDQLLFGADSGKLVNVTSCATCNRMDVVSDNDIKTMSYDSDGQVLLAGGGFWFDIIGGDTMRHYGIGAAQAKSEQESGDAQFVDVRTVNEFAAGHIPGAINVPLSEISSGALESAIPDKSAKIIFYCVLGARSQSALDEAIALGYERVYNLGGIENDWPYELTVDS
ncbi:MAG: rhodanese-like domain-containing protein [Oscillospiraceae bacterium]|nr:rhodanese-like domain-containing protein [Oscillospiraceae bacterium]